MNIDKQNIVIALLVIVIVGLLFQNRNVNARLSALETSIETAAASAQEASEYSKEASEKAFGNICGHCPEGN